MSKAFCVKIAYSFSFSKKKVGGNKMIINNKLPKLKEKKHNFVMGEMIINNSVRSFISFTNPHDINIYSNADFTLNNNYYIFENSDDLIVYIYNNQNTKLLYTNRQIKYNSNTSKYELYGYFLTTATNLNATITTDGWQTIELGSPNLFK